eukprot:scaffold65191_cov36-Phaeocystis_antarctica.AAC.2
MHGLKDDSKQSSSTQQRQPSPYQSSYASANAHAQIKHAIEQLWQIEQASDRAGILRGPPSKIGSFSCNA